MSEKTSTSCRLRGPSAAFVRRHRDREFDHYGHDMDSILRSHRTVRAPPLAGAPSPVAVLRGRDRVRRAILTGRDPRRSRATRHRGPPPPPLSSLSFSLSRDMEPRYDSFMRDVWLSGVPGLLLGAAFVHVPSPAPTHRPWANPARRSGRLLWGCALWECSFAARASRTR